MTRPRSSSSSTTRHRFDLATGASAPRVRVNAAAGDLLVVGKNAGGHEMFRIHGAEGGSNSPSLLALGANVAQVDNA